MAKSILADTMAIAAQSPTLTLVPPPNDDETVPAAVIRDLDALAMTRKLTLNVDVQVVARRIRATLRRVRSHPVYEQLKTLASVGLFDFEVLNRLARNAPALWLIGHHARQERLQNNRVLSEEVATRATSVRMQLARVAQYHFGSDPVEGVTVNAITNVLDYQRLANDLRYLHDLFTRMASTMSHDPHYNIETVQEAGALANTIVEAFDRREENHVRWVERSGALWALVRADYDELQTSGRWLLRANPEEAKRVFPSAVPAPPRGRKAANDDVGDDTDETKAEEIDDQGAGSDTDESRDDGRRSKVTEAKETAEKAIDEAVGDEQVRSDDETNSGQGAEGTSNGARIPRRPRVARAQTRSGRVNASPPPAKVPSGSKRTHTK